VKNLFRHRKVRYKGLAKNEAQLFTLFGLANLMLARRHFAGAYTGEVRLENGESGENLPI
jgi:IS5 family transposase